MFSMKNLYSLNQLVPIFPVHTRSLVNQLWLSGSSRIRRARERFS